MPNERPPIDYIARTEEQYSALGYPIYRWVKSETPPPWAPLRKPLAESRVALIASGGLYVAGQIAFHFKDDLSYREVATHTPTHDLRVTHFAYDQQDARSDPNVVFPIDTLRGLVDEGKLGALAERAYTFMGGIYSSRKVKEKLAPALANRVIEDEVDLVLLVPV